MSNWHTDKYCCEDMELTVETGNIWWNEEENGWFAWGDNAYGGLSPFRITHCMFCDTELPEPPKEE